MSDTSETRQRLERMRDATLALWYAFLGFVVLLLFIPVAVFSIKLVGYAMHGLPCP